MGMKSTERLIEFGQSLWYDNLGRTMLDNGELQRLIDSYGLRGMTSNPTIFDNAISKSSIYDATILGLKGRSTADIFETLAVDDVGRAADLLLPVYRSSGGDDGFVSIEVSPLVAHDAQSTIVEAQRLHQKLSRPNVMIKVPGTAEGIEAIETLLADGISINATLLFSVANYDAVARAYCRALRTRVGRGESVEEVRSVASFFVSRVDSLVDKKLEEIAHSDPDRAAVARGLFGKFGVANSRVAYQRFREIFEGTDFADLRDAGAAVQRPLWASTGVKNPSYRDVLYVEQLIGPHTVNTVPHDTLLAFADHGEVRVTVENELDEALALEPRLSALGIDMVEVFSVLQREGVRKFVDSFAALDRTIAQKVGNPM